MSIVGGKGINPRHILPISCVSVRFQSQPLYSFIYKPRQRSAILGVSLHMYKYRVFAMHAVNGGHFVAQLRPLVCISRTLTVHIRRHFLERGKGLVSIVCATFLWLKVSGPIV